MLLQLPHTTYKPHVDDYCFKQGGLVFFHLEPSGFCAIPEVRVSIFSVVNGGPGVYTASQIGSVKKTVQRYIYCIYCADKFIVTEN